MIPKEQLKELFNQSKETNPNLSLDQLLYDVYEKAKTNEEETFDTYRPLILEANNINEYEYYTQNVSEALKKYVQEKVWPELEKNDKAHGIVHIIEVTRRVFALNDTYKLGLEPDLMYAIANFHDVGKYEDHKIHEKIAGKRFWEDEFIKEFFSEDDRITAREAIEDHRSSNEDTPRSIYGKLISSADRNTRIEIVFIRSFFVAKERMPDMNIEEYLEYTHDRLSKKYSEENPENMFLEDETYKVFLADMRALLKDKEKFKEKYCEVNHIKSRNHIVEQEQGETKYLENNIICNKEIYEGEDR